MRTRTVLGGCRSFHHHGLSRLFGDTRVCSLAGAIALSCGSALAGPVAWKNSARPEAPDQRLSAQPINSELRAAASRNTQQSQGGYVLVDLGRTPDFHLRQALATSGMTLLDPVSATTYFARVHASANTEALGDLIEDAGPILRSHKTHPLIENNDIPSWSIVSGNRSTAKNPRSGASEDPVVAAYVMMQKDVDSASPEMDALVASYDGVVRSVVMSMNTLVVEMPLSKLKTLADDERVQWIEPPLPPMQTTNDSNRAITQVNTAQSAPYALDGTGVTVLVYDGGSVRATHNDFSGRVTNIDSSAVNYHSTHVAGTIGGDGSTNINNRGMAPGVNILSAGFEVPGGLSQGFLYTDPGDLEADYTLAMSLGATISNNSIGANVAQNGYPCSWHGDYGITAGVIDNVIRGSLGDPITVFWAAGNERGNGACGSSYGTTAPPSNNKNAISIGALNSNNDTMTTFSSWGPSDDGRLRPVVSAPGCQSSGDFGVTSTGDGSDSQYITLCGTSMASPTAAGIGALIVQDFRAQFPGVGDPSNQLMKVILIEGAVDILNTGPDFQSGYGSIRAVNSIDFLRTGNFREDTVDQASVSTFTVNVDPGDPEFRVTIAWDDPAGAPNVSPELVNDLDLVVVDPAGTRHYPWTLNPSNPSTAAVRTQEDHLNNIEQVFLQNPIAGIWQVQVVGTAVAQGPQSFALASALDLGEGLLSLSLSEEAPQVVLPGTEIEVTALVSEGVDTVVPGSVRLNYRFKNEGYSTIQMADNGDGSYSASIPGARCGEFVEYYISADGSTAGSVFTPPAGPGNPLRSEVGEVKVVMSDTFETDNGWTVTSTATDGQWTRGVPVDCLSRGAPGSDSDGSGQCWITDNDAGESCNSDIDNGVTTLTSPIYSMPDGGEFSFDYWFADIPTGELNGDEWGVDASSDGGETWARVRTVTVTSQTWRTDTIRVGQEVDASSIMRFRFSASDAGTQNVIEAGLDHIRITQLVCEDAPACLADLNGDGELDFLDISAFITAFGNQSSEVDFTQDGNFDFLDISLFIASFNGGCP